MKDVKNGALSSANEEKGSDVSKPEKKSATVKQSGKKSSPREEVSREIVQVQETTPQSMIMQAIDKGASVEALEKLFNLQERWEKNQAKKAFDQAMTEAQGEMPEIKKTKSVSTKSGVKAYSYAPLESIISQVKGILSSHGLSYSIKTEMSKDESGLIIGVKSTVVVKHIAGHSEAYEMEVPLGNKTDIMSQSQVIAAASTFSKRYAFSNAFGIMTADEDKEEELKGAEASKGQVEAAIMLLEKCTTDQQVVDIWNSFAKELKANDEVRAKTKEMRQLIIDAKKHENENL